MLRSKMNRKTAGLSYTKWSLSGIPMKSDEPPKAKAEQNCCYEGKVTNECMLPATRKLNEYGGLIDGRQHNTTRQHKTPTSK